MNAPETANPPRAADRNLDMLCHLLALAGLTGIPLGNVLGPLILWLLKREEYPSVNDHGKESINFQISMTIWTLIAGLSLFVVIGIVLLPVAIVLNIVLVVIASVKASKGESYRYPLTIRFLK